MVHNKDCYQLLLSLLPLSCIVVPRRELGNTLHSFDTYILFNPEIYNTINMNMEIDTPRDWSTNSSTNNSREVLVQSNVSFISYVKRIDAQNNNPL